MLRVFSKYFFRSNTPAVILAIAILLLEFAQVAVDHPSRFPDQPQITTASIHAVQAATQPTKLINENAVSISFVLAKHETDPLRDASLDHFSILSPNVVLLPSHLVYTLTTSSRL